MTSAAQLIKTAYFLAKAQDPNEVLSGYQQSVGLNVLNGIIEQWSALGIYIPYYTKLTISLLTGVGSYTFTPIISEIFQGNIVDSNNVQYILEVADLKRQNALNYNLSLQYPSIPHYVYLENTSQSIAPQSILWFYPVPVADYTCTLYVKRVITDLTYSKNINDFPAFYFKPITYQLALELSIINSTKLGERFDKEYQNTIEILKSTVAKDYSVVTRNVFRNNVRFRPWGSYVG